jgi:hypothetical protein
VTLPAAGSTVGAPGAAPVVATPQSSAAAASSAASGRSAAFGLSTGQRRLAAALVIAMELVGFLLLLGDRGLERAASGAGVALAAGGRLRVPDRLARGDGPSARMGGVGRLRAERSGPVPHL